MNESKSGSSDLSPVDAQEYLTRELDPNDSRDLSLSLTSRRKHEKTDTTSIDDEFQGDPRVSLKPIQPVIFEANDGHGNKETKDLTEPLEDHFAYLAATRGPEIDTVGCQLLQGYVDRMVEDVSEWKGRVRVTILNKGEPNAFACPDGSVFISQSLINLLGSLDEVVAVLAHEVNHILNGTSRVAFSSQVRRGTSLGVDWLHEMASDIESSLLLEKLGLKTTAMAEALTKLGNLVDNQRGTEHQAPIMRAVEHLGVHAVRDFETSHLDLVDKPDVLKKEAKRTNLDLTFKAVSENDVERVRELVSKLHPQDFATFFQAIDKGYLPGNYKSLHSKSSREIAQLVGELTVNRLTSQGLSLEEVKLFFLCCTESYSKLAPTFTNLDQVCKYVELADQMFQRRAIQTATNELFGEAQWGDPLKEILDMVIYRFDAFTDKSALQHTDIDTLANFIGLVYKIIKDEMPSVEDGGFVTENGDSLNSGSNRYVDLYRKLGYVLFNVYISRFYLTGHPDGELDQNQIEDIFQEIKDRGYLPLDESHYFPIGEEIIGPLSRKVIEQAFFNVFNKNLVKYYPEQEEATLLPLNEFKEQLKVKKKWEITSFYAEVVRNKNLTHEEKLEYTDAMLEFMNQLDLTSAHLGELIRDRIGYSDFARWSETGSPEYTSGGKPTNQFDTDQLIQFYNLDREFLYGEASRRAELERTKLQIDFISEALGNSEDLLFNALERIMQQTQVDVSHVDQYQLLALSQPIFALANRDDLSSQNRIVDFERFSKLRFIHEIAARVETVSFDTLEDLLRYVTEVKSHLRQHPIGARFELYEDNVYSVMLAKPVRDEMLRLTQPGLIKKGEYPVLLKILTDNFPSSPQRRELIKQVQSAYLIDSEITIQEKIDFYFSEVKLLGFEGAITVAEQIDDVETYRGFQARLGQLEASYISGEQSVDGIAVSDIASSMLTKKADVMIRTASGKSRDAKEVSTDMAIAWVETYLGENRFRKNDVMYDPDSGKFVLSNYGRSTFVSFDDTVEFFKQLPRSKRLAIALKALTDQDGLLVTEQGRILLEKMLVDGLGLSGDFFKQLIGSAVGEGDAKVVGLPAAQMIAPFLFRALETEKVDYDRIGNVRIRSGEGSDYVYTKISDQDFYPDLPEMLGKSTRDLRFFGFRYHHQPNSELAQEAQNSGEIYFQTLQNLQKQFESKSETDEVVESQLSAPIEAVIKAGETSPVFVRGMQMAVQLIDFDPAVRERLSKTQDSMHGMEKLRFWDNLLSKARTDVDLANFIENELITLDSYLGGGSLFTTYGATVKGTGGNPRKVVIKMLNPNSEEFIRMSHEFSETALGNVESETRGKTRQQARLARSLLDLSSSWCIRDINDDTYSERDDAFRSLLQSFNQKRGSEVVTAPERMYTSKKVKIEEQHSGITLNKMLRSDEFSRESKSLIVAKLLDFFDYQFETPTLTAVDGESLFVFHSDPHAGNYMLDPDSDDSQLGVIDRSMYLALEAKDVEMFKIMKAEKGREFITQFVERCLEINGLEGAEFSRIKSVVLGKLLIESMRQRMTGSNETSAYLQIILQEFANYGERFSTIEGAPVDLSENERLIIKYFASHPNTDAMQAYSALGKRMSHEVGDDKDFPYPKFKKIVDKLHTNGLLKKKSIEVPIDYRLMIRNIVAMQNLRKEWLG